MNDIVVGIDLGTTFSAIGHVDDSGSPRIIPNRENENTTPSVVLIEGDKFIVGRLAQNQAVARPGDVVRCIKRQMGTDFLVRERWTPEEISAEILRKVVDDAAENLGKPIQRAVITVPAYFNATQRARTQKAGELAGLHVEEPLDEPEAAAIYYGVSHLKDGERLLVCDLGGGTYDATILVMDKGVLRAANTDGTRKLGGHDWTNKLVEMMAEEIEERLSADPRDDLLLHQLLYNRCEEAKCQLSIVPSVKIPWSQNGQTFNMEVTRTAYEERCSPLILEVLHRTSGAMEQISLTVADINHVLLVGGSSRLPSFVTAIGQLTAKTPRRVPNPDEAVALGAAIVADGYARGGLKGNTGRITVMSGRGAHQASLTIQRTTAHALGTRIAENQADPPRIISDSLIDRNTPLPAHGERDYALQPGQTTFQVPVVELNAYGAVLDHWKNYRFYDAPKRQERSIIRVRFEVTAVKMPNVIAMDVQSGERLKCEVVAYQEPEIKAVLAEPTPATVVFAIDCSISMDGEKLTEARKALLDVAREYGSKGWSMAVVSFGGPRQIFPAKVLQPLTRSLDEIGAAVQQLEAHGSTPMEAGMEKIREILESVPGKRVAIVVTDGQPDDVGTTRQRAQSLRDLQIHIGTVPVGSDADRQFLDTIGDVASNIKVDDQGRGTAAAILDILSKIKI